MGETWLIGGTTFFPSDYTHPNGYHQILQTFLHATYLTVDRGGGSGDIKVSMMAFTKGLGSASKVVRTVSFKRGGWTTWVIRNVVTKNGRCEMSVNGDAFKGIDVDFSIGHIHKGTVGKVAAHGGTFGSYLTDKGGTKDIFLAHGSLWIKRA